MPTLTDLAALVRRRSGLVIGPDKRYLLETRLAALLRHEGLADLDALACHLRGGEYPELEQAVAEAMATHETLFFRDGKPFEHLRLAGLPGLLRNRPAGSKLRMWSAAAASGQEAYSMAITAVEAGATEQHRVEIVGTDFASDPLRRAGDGCFTQYEVQRGLSVQRLVRHFANHGQEWRVVPGLRALCTFRPWNLLDDPAPLGRFDVVFCRNVLFYFDIPTKIRVLAAIVRLLAPGGLLYLGSSETAMGLSDRLERDGPSHTVTAHAPA